MTTSPVCWRIVLVIWRLKASLTFGRVERPGNSQPPSPRADEQRAVSLEIQVQRPGQHVRDRVVCNLVVLDLLALEHEPDRLPAAGPVADDVAFEVTAGQVAQADRHEQQGPNRYRHLRQ